VGGITTLGPPDPAGWATTGVDLETRRVRVLWGLAVLGRTAEQRQFQARYQAFMEIDETLADGYVQARYQHIIISLTTPGRAGRSDARYRRRDLWRWTTTPPWRSTQLRPGSRSTTTPATTEGSGRPSDSGPTSSQPAQPVPASTRRRPTRRRPRPTSLAPFRARAARVGPQPSKGTRVASTREPPTAIGGMMAAIFLVLAVLDAALLGNVLLVNRSAG
jgi:hypothetical protein